MKETNILRPYTLLSGVDPLIAGRWSSRSFASDRPVSDQIINRLFEAARWAPSAMNNQPWRFLSLGPEDKLSLERARSVLNRGNSWALKAPRLLFILAKKTRPNSGDLNRLADYETGMAAAQMALQATREGLVFHQMAGFNREALREIFHLSEDLKILTAVALGFPGTEEDVPPEKREGERVVRKRKPVEELRLTPT